MNNVRFSFYLKLTNFYSAWSKAQGNRNLLILMAFFALPEIKSFTVFGLGFILEGIVQLKLTGVERKSIVLPLSHCGRNYKFLASQMMDDGQILLHSGRPQLIIRPIH
jgi:hypothetical protein